MKSPSIILLAILMVGCESIFFDEEPTDSAVESFEVFWQDFDRYYPYFPIKEIDWDSVHDASIEHLQDNPGNTQLRLVLEGVITQLGDGHVGLFAGTEFITPDLCKDCEANAPVNLQNYADNIDIINGTIISGTINNEIGYIAVNSFSRSAGTYSGLPNLIRSFSGMRGLIIDVRNNGGGNDAFGLLMTKELTGQAIKFSSHTFRSGPDRLTDFTDPIPRFTPFSENPMGIDIVVLTNRRCYSSCEGYVMSMRVLPNVTVLGDTTGGGSGNPMTRELPNGWTFRMSSWFARDENDQHFEGIGLIPDEVVWNVAGAEEDLMLEAAIERLSQ